MENQMRDLLKNVYSSINTIVEDINVIVEFYRGGAEGEANKKMINIIDDLSVVLEGVKITQSIQKEKIEVDEINDYLLEMIEAFENSDSVLFCDLLEYELIPILNKFEKKVLVTIGE